MTKLEQRKEEFWEKHWKPYFPVPHSHPLREIYVKKKKQEMLADLDKIIEEAREEQTRAFIRKYGKELNITFT